MKIIESFSIAVNWIKDNLISPLTDRINKYVNKIFPAIKNLFCKNESNSTLIGRIDLGKSNNSSQIEDSSYPNVEKNCKDVVGEVFMQIYKVPQARNFKFIERDYFDFINGREKKFLAKVNNAVSYEISLSQNDLRAIQENIINLKLPAELKTGFSNLLNWLEDKNISFISLKDESANKNTTYLKVNSNHNGQLVPLSEKRYSDQSILFEIPSDILKLIKDAFSNHTFLETNSLEVECSCCIEEIETDDSKIAELRQSLKTFFINEKIQIEQEISEFYQMNVDLEKELLEIQTQKNGYAEVLDPQRKVIVQKPRSQLIKEQEKLFEEEKAMNSKKIEIRNQETHILAKTERLKKIDQFLSHFKD